MLLLLLLLLLLLFLLPEEEERAPVPSVMAASDRLSLATSPCLSNRDNIRPLKDKKKEVVREMREMMMNEIREMMVNSKVRGDGQIKLFYQI